MSVQKTPAHGQLACSPEQAAPLLGVSCNLMYSLLREGRIHTVRAGRRFIVPFKAIEAFLRGES